MSEESLPETFINDFYASFLEHLADDLEEDTENMNLLGIDGMEEVFAKVALRSVAASFRYTAQGFREAKENP